MGCRRKTVNRDLPKNLIRHGKYFKYKHPVTKKWIGLGTDRYQAIEAAKIANARFESELTIKELSHRIEGIIPLTVSDLVVAFKQNYLPEKQIRASTLETTTGRCDQIAELFGSKPLIDIDTPWLQQEALDRRYKRKVIYASFRKIWEEMFDYAVSLGWVEKNPAKGTLHRKRPEKTRGRWTLETFKATYAKAPDWLQIAMLFALYSTQSLNECCTARFSDYDEYGNLRVVRKKTDAALKISAGPGLKSIIRRARATGIASPFILHMRPKRIVRCASKEHWTQINLRYAQQHLQKAREATGLFDDVPALQQPTFHEIRALSAHLMEKFGEDITAIQAVMGHTNPETTELYLKEHEGRFKEVSAPLKELKL